YIANITQHALFDGVVMVTIILNALFMALETDYNLKYKLFGLFQVDELFMAIYAMEFLMKVYVEPWLYWTNGYNVFDAFILVISFVPVFVYGENPNQTLYMRIIRLCSSLRVLKVVAFIRGLQALTAALFKTTKSVVYVLSLMFLLMFIFALNGYYYFGDPTTGDPDNWGDLGSALFSLFDLVTLDGWTDMQQKLDDLGLVNSRIFTILFILICYFILFNMFIGVVIIEIQRFENDIQSEREASLAHKKHAITQRQKNEIRKLIQSNERNLTKLVETFKKSLRHSDYMVMEDLCTSMSFTDLYLTTLGHQDHTSTPSRYHVLVVILFQVPRHIRRNLEFNNDAASLIWTRFTSL
uniref:Cation channel sperm associated 3 n=1 Tax=Esox lucius TaxID=8010 RepID=A0A3P9ADQ1_ESOLU